MAATKTGGSRNFIRKFRRWIDLIELYGIMYSKETRFPSPMSWLGRIKALRKGFLSDSYIQYFKNGDQNRLDYLSDFDRWRKVPAINAKYGIVLADKLLFYDFFHPFQDIIPTVHFFIKNGRLFHRNHQPADPKELIAIVQLRELLIGKPRSGFGGRGLLKLKKHPEGVKINDVLVRPQELDSYLKNLDNYIITDFVSQKGYANEIFPDAVNTLRILTVIDPETFQPRVAGIAHRFGSSTTGIVDNWTSGGISAAVDLETGTIGRCAQNPKGQDVKWITHHPDTERAISGVQIPYWSETIARILEMHRFCTYCPYIGWDVAMDGDRFWILEANDSPDVHILQIHEPLYKNPLNRKFYQFHRVIE